jgi:hypothetical protein
MILDIDDELSRQQRKEVESWVKKSLNRINQATFVEYMETNNLDLATTFRRDHLYIPDSDFERYEMYTPLLELIEPTQQRINV